MSTQPRPSISRRNFLRASTVASAAALAPRAKATPRLTRIRPDRLRIGVIGVGGKGYSDTQAVDHEQIVAIADVDWKNASRAFETWPHARRYYDYREMLDHEELDAVVVSTPDHSHAPASMMAMAKGLHVYCQKPLTHSVEEARLMAMAANRYGVMTQMGNQGTAAPGFREAVEVIRSGAIGAVREVHVWTNRPVWPQGIARPTEIEAIPEHLRWDLFLGSAPYRPYHSSYQPFNWRGWWDYGTGALGDMACHIMNLPFTALKLGYPTTVRAEQVDGLNDETAPNRSVVRFHYPARDEFPAVDLSWYDGGLKPPADLLPADFEMAIGGAMLVGEEGILYSADDYGRVYTLFPEAKFRDYKVPEPTIPRVEIPPELAEVRGEGALISLEWLNAIRGEGLPSSHFGHSGPFTESILLGNVALRLDRKLTYDASRLRAKGDADATALMRKDYPRGFELPWRWRDTV